MTADATPHELFLATFNEELERLECAARVAAIPDTVSEIKIVDGNGTAIGRIPSRIEPGTFAAFMIVVENNVARATAGMPGGQTSR